MEPPTSVSAESINSRTAELLGNIYSRGPLLLELTKVKISFWDKLVVVNAGSLALSLTAAGFFRGHPVGDGGSGYLLAAWKLLISSIILSLVAQWAATATAVLMNRQLTALDTHLKLVGIERDVKVAGFAMKESAVKLMGDSEEEAKRMGRSVKVAERVAHISGALAQISTAAAFIWLYRFAQVNLGR